MSPASAITAPVEDAFVVELVKDIYPGSSGANASEFVAFGDKVLFRANDGVNGQELWVTDGTAEGTTLVKDIYPGTNNNSGYPQHLTVFGDQVIFSANDAVNGNEVWTTDGTAEGTTILKDIIPGTGSSYPSEFVASGDKVLFRAYDAVNGYELWTTDGTTSGTTLVKDIYPGAGGSYVSQMVTFGDKILFNARDDVSGTELWITDGTAEGTTLVKDIYPGTGSSYYYDEIFEMEGMSRLAVVGDKALFQANDGVNGQELWITDGTDEGTTLVKDIYSGSNYGSPSYFVTVGDKAMFRANDAVNGYELWASDGTAEGTTLVKDIRPGTDGGYPEELLAFGGKVLFRANDAVNGQELWITDGTAEGTTLVKDIYPGTNGGYPYELAAVGNRVLFQATDGVIGHELWSFTFPDTTAPVVTITTSGDNVAVGKSLTAAFTCSDEGGSNIATCTATLNGVAITNGASISTAAVGVKTLKVTATDGAGNTTTKTITIKVVAAPVVEKDNPRELKGDYAASSGAPGSVARMYMAVFNRQPDAGGHAFWVQHSVKDLTMWEIADYFASSEEFAATYDDLDNGDFVALLYTNVMGRTGETSGHEYWTSLLDNGTLTRGGVTLQFSESHEFKVLTKSS